MAGTEPGVCASAAPLDAGASSDAGAPAFGAPELVDLVCNDVPCISPRDPSLIEDRKQIVFTVETLNAAGDLDVYIANRPTAFDPWSPAAQAGAIDSLYVEEGGWVSGNGLRLYFTRRDQNVAGPPFGEVWVGDRLAVTDPFDGAAPLAGVINTSQGDERSASHAIDGTRLVFARAIDADVADHDVYLALASGGQWDTASRIDALSLAGTDERSVAVVEANRTLFVSRGDRIVEARWSGGLISGAEVVATHDELVVSGADRIAGIWASPDGSEIWFGACGATCSIYRAVR